MVVVVGGGQRDVAVAALVSDLAHLGQNPHGLLAGWGLHRVAGQVGLAAVPGPDLLLLPGQRVVLVQEVVLVQQGVLVQWRG